jgi:hypothetical protein
MKNEAANSSAEQAVTGDSRAPGEYRHFGPPPLETIWTWKSLSLFVLFAVLIHLILISIFGSRSQIMPRTVSHVPRLQIAGASDPLIALGNPTLFALPNPRDFISAIWFTIPAVGTHSFRWSEPPRWLSLPTGNPDATFKNFTKSPAIPPMPAEVKPPLPFNAEPVPIGIALPMNSSLKISGPLGRRGLRSSVVLPSIPYDNVIPPSRIQVLVDESGNVVSAVLLPSTDMIEAIERNDAADQQALAISRHLRFAPATQLDLGELIFRWCTAPTNLTNSPSGL